MSDSEPRFPREFPIGKYRLSKFVRKGGDGELWKAVELTSSGEWSPRPIAIKILYSTTDDAKKRFRQEIKLLKELKHPNVIDIRDWGPVPGESLDFYAMEYIDKAKNFDDYVLSPAKGTRVRFLSTIRQVLEGLAALHAKRIRHGDIKPSNLLVSVTDVLKITDFGYAWSDKEPEPVRTAFGSAKVEVPEHIRGFERDVYLIRRYFQLILENIEDTSEFDHEELTWLRNWLREIREGPLPTSAKLKEEFQERLRQQFLSDPTWEGLPAELVRETVVQVYSPERITDFRGALVHLLLQQRERKNHAINREKLLNFLQENVRFDATPPRVDMLESIWNGQRVLDEEEYGLLARAILFGNPLAGKQQRLFDECRTEWRFLEALIRKTPESPLKQGLEDPARIQQWAYLLFRKEQQLQVDKWDAAVEFLGAGPDTDIFLVSGLERFAIADVPELRDAAHDSVSRGSHIVFVVPDYSCDATKSAFEFVERVRGSLRRKTAAGCVRVRRLKLGQATRRRIAGTQENLLRDAYFTPCLRFVLFLTFDKQSRRPGKGAFFVGLPRDATSAFAYEYRREATITQRFTSWLRWTVPRSFRRVRFEEET